MFDLNDEFGPPRFTGIVGRRFEPLYDSERGIWCITDREAGTLYECEDEYSANLEANSLEFVRKVVGDLAHHFTVA